MDLKSDVLTLQNQCPKVNPSVSKISLPLQNLLGRDASPRHFSSLQTEFPRQGCIAPGFFILADRIFSAGMHRLCNYAPSLPGAPPQSAELTSIHLNACRAYPRSPPSSPQFTSTLAGRTLIKPAVPIFKLPAFIPDDLFPVSRGTFRIQFRMTNSVSHDEFSLRMTSSVSA